MAAAGVAVTSMLDGVPLISLCLLVDGVVVYLVKFDGVAVFLFLTGCLSGEV